MIPKKGETTWPEAVEAELRQLWADGLSSTEIGRRIDRTKNAVLGRIHRLGLSNRQSPIAAKEVTEEAKASVILCLSNGLPIKHIMQVTGVTRLSVERIRDGRPTPVVATGPKVIPAYRLPKPAPVARVFVAPRPVFVAPRPVAKVVPFTEARGPCQWIDGHDRKTWRQCDAMSVTGAGIKPPYAYCAHHRSIAYVRRSEAAA